MRLRFLLIVALFALAYLLMPGVVSAAPCPCGCQVTGLCDCCPGVKPAKASLIIQVGPVAPRVVYIGRVPYYYNNRGHYAPRPVRPRHR